MGRNRASKNKNRTDNVGTKASVEPMETVASDTTSSVMGDDKTDKSDKQVADKMEKYTTEDTSSGENNSKDATQFDKNMKDLTYYVNKCSSLKANLRASEKKVDQRNTEIKKLEEEKADLEAKNLELSKRLTKLQEDWENLKREKSNTADSEQLAMDVDPNKDESLEQQMKNNVPQFQSVQLQCRPTTTCDSSWDPEQPSTSWCGKQPHKQPSESKKTEHKSLSSGAKQYRRISDDTKSNISSGGKHPCVSHQSSIYYKQSGDSGKYQRGRGNRPDMKMEWNTNYKINHDRSSGRLMLEKPAEYKVVREVDGDLFEAPEDNSLAHCVAEDMCMGSGIAVTFKREFKSVDELLDQHKRQGDVAVLEQSQRYIYYLVTKRVSNGKPTMDTLERSLIAMREHVVTNKVTKIAMPRIGCGLDRLEWNRVKPLIEYVFSGLDVTITVYNLREGCRVCGSKKQVKSDSDKFKESDLPVNKKNSSKSKRKRGRK